MTTESELDAAPSERVWHDTNAWSQTIPEFLGVLEGMGFREVLKLAIEGTPDHFHVFWKTGLLIKLDTYGGRHINAGTCYFNFRGPWRALRGSNRWIRETKDGPEYEVDFDIRQWLGRNLDEMAKSGVFLEKWTSRPFLWLLHHGDTKKDGYDYRAINAERIALLPEDVRAAISPLNTDSDL